ncbi:hypothetical protein GCM10017688_29700 [Streptomyces ramulosus]
MQQAGVDELVEVEGGELAGDAHAGGCLVPRHGAALTSDERVHLSPGVLAEGADGLDRGIAGRILRRGVRGHVFTVTRTLVGATGGTRRARAWDLGIQGPADAFRAQDQDLLAE